MNLTLLDLVLALALLLAAAAALSDLRTGLIPNRLVVFGFAAGLLGNAAVGAMQSGTAGILLGLSHGFVGACACAPLPLALFFAGGLGGGDTKLFIALGSLLGPMLGVGAELYAFVVGALYVLVVLAIERALVRRAGASFARLRTTQATNTPPLEARGADYGRRTVRFAPAICIGTAIALFAPLGTL